MSKFSLVFVKTKKMVLGTWNFTFLVFFLSPQFVVSEIFDETHFIFEARGIFRQRFFWERNVQ